MKEPVDHIERPTLPWRVKTDIVLTECGYSAAKVKTLTRSQFLARFIEMGERRTAILTCMTCSDTARRWGTWQDDPRQALDREIQWERRKQLTLLKTELLAIAQLIERHREEFDAFIKDAALWEELRRLQRNNP